MGVLISSVAAAAYVADSLDSDQRGAKRMPVFQNYALRAYPKAEDDDEKRQRGAVVGAPVIIVERKPEDRRATPAVRPHGEG